MGLHVHGGCAMGLRVHGRADRELRQTDHAVQTGRKTRCVLRRADMLACVSHEVRGEGQPGGGTREKGRPSTTIKSPLGKFAYSQLHRAQNEIPQMQKSADLGLIFTEPEPVS